MFSTRSMPRRCHSAPIYLTHSPTSSSSPSALWEQACLKAEVFTTQHSPLEFLELREHVGPAVRQVKDRRVRLAIWTFCIGVHLSVCLSAHLSVCLSVCTPVYLSICLSAHLYICMSVCTPICLSVCLHTCLSIYLSICTPLYLSICLHTCRYIYLSFCTPA